MGEEAEKAGSVVGRGLELEWVRGEVLEGGDPTRIRIAVAVERQHWVGRLAVAQKRMRGC